MRRRSVGVIEKPRCESVTHFCRLGHAATEGSGSAFGLARASVFWGCPEWAGRMGNTTYVTNNAAGISPYENGYSYNWWCNYTPQTALGIHPPYSGTAIDDDTENQIKGTWP